MMRRLKAAAENAAATAKNGTIAGGIALILAFAASGGAEFFRLRDWLQQFTREEPPAAAPEPPVPLEPVKIMIRGPQPAVMIEGVSGLFLADVTGPAGRPEWRLTPGDGGTLRPSGNMLEFLPGQSGRYSLVVSVAGDGRQIATDQIELEIVHIREEESEADAMPPADSSQANVPPPAPKPPTVAELAAGALAAVEPDNRASEARIVAGCFKSVIGRINAGFIAPDADPMLEVEAQVNAALGAHAGKWATFLGSMGIVLEQLRQQGHVTTAASKIPALSEMSAVLGQAP
jgi:hypothetical protein